MCRSIKQLRGDEALTDEDIRAAALQFVRKVSGYRKPSQANTEVFDRAVEEIAMASRELLGGLTTPAPRPARSG
jgi:hypothetical protein